MTTGYFLSGQHPVTRHPDKGILDSPCKGKIASIQATGKKRNIVLTKIRMGVTVLSLNTA